MAPRKSVSRRKVRVLRRTRIEEARKLVEEVKSSTEAPPQAAPEVPPQPKIICHPRYNVIGVPPETDMQTVESVCFGANWPSEMGGLGGYGHLKNFLQLTYDWIEWNPWLEESLRAMADDTYAVRIGDTKLKFINITGPGSASKTTASGIFACAYFMVDVLRNGDPRTSVTLTSTSKGIINQRVWPIIQRCFHEAKRVYADGQPGVKFKWAHMVDSQKMVMAVRRDGTKDAKHSICAMAVESGELAKAVDKIKGRHTERMVLIIDEANSTPQAIFDCIPNMLTSVRELIVITLGNAISRLDPHGMCCEPAAGWRSVTIDTPQWDTKGVPKWGIGPGVCLHFDGATSPNVIAGRTIYKHIYSFERWEHVGRMGEEYRNTLQHWSQDRGFWPPDGLQTTVFTEALVVANDGTGNFTWIDQPRPIGALDTAFGGDDCVYQPGLLGLVRGPKLALQLLQPVLVPFDPESTDSIDYQIARWIIARCQREGVVPELFGLDATGTGRGVAAFVQQLWSPRIQSVEFGGSASELPASLNDPRQSHEVYSNKVSELWYACRELLVGGQLRGLGPDAVKEFCSRTYEFKSRRYSIEPKREMKKRLGYSPDHADAVAIACEVVRRNGLKPAGSGGSTSNSGNERAWEEVSRDIASITQGDYSAANEFAAYAEVS